MIIDMSMDAKMCLTKMGLIYERLEGERFKLSSIQSIVAVINSSLEAVNEEYKKYFEAFLTHLTPSQVEELCNNGAIIYRGASPAPNQQEPRGNPGGKTLFYRGQKLEAEEVEPQPLEEKAKPKRVYRGRVIEE